ncbi:hypothetical protein O3P69_006923 [Scylla paramamosain]|uniref:Uncharacterized protein n=1 Tax=Scylla paramamosain TaxID=85552 RepID=A0AAW0U1S8_SCYPA
MRYVSGFRMKCIAKRRCLPSHLVRTFEDEHWSSSQVEQLRGSGYLQMCEVAVHPESLTLLSHLSNIPQHQVLIHTLGRKLVSPAPGLHHHAAALLVVSPGL